MQLSLQREPGFFIGAGIGNLATTVIVARDAAAGHVVATAARAIRRAFVDGAECPLGYLSTLRTAGEVRNTTVVARGYRYLKLQHADGRVPYYVTTILEGNEEARRILTSGRAGLPAYVSYGKLRTFLLPLYGFRRRCRGSGVVRGAAPEALPAALACLNRFNAGLQFAPAYRLEDLVPGPAGSVSLRSPSLTPGGPIRATLRDRSAAGEPCHAVEDLATDSGMLHGLSPANLYLRLQGSEVAGTMAVWNQNGFKQSVVAGYSRGLAVARPALALAARFGLAPRLPPIGRSLPCLYAALISSRDSDVAVFQELLDAVLADYTNSGYAYLLLGLSGRHPFSRVVEKQSVMTIDSGIYLVCWPDCDPASLPSTDLVPHLEVATL